MSLLCSGAHPARRDDALRAVGLVIEGWLRWSSRAEIKVATSSRRIDQAEISGLGVVGDN